MSEFAAIKITDKVYWVGAIDNTLRNFHGYETSRGTTYNAYLILGEKPILIDTVKAPFFTEMLERIKSVIAPEKIAYIISNHAEMDHSGCLPETIELVQPEKIFASKIGAQALKDHFHFDIAINEIKNGEAFALGDAKFQCLETRMLHWPDSMFTYFINDGILFSQDGFGMHLATYKLFATQNSRELMEHETRKYFANILLPYSAMVTKLFAALPSFKLDIKLIAPDHGPIWNTPEDINWILSLWQKWALQQPQEKVVVIYDTMWNSTAKMANVIANGAAAKNVEVKLMPLAVSHRSDIATEILEAGALIVGSPTINQQMFPTVADILCYLKGLKPQNLIGQTFGSYGWGAEAIKLMQDELKSMNVSLIEDPIKVKYVPNEEILQQCKILGQKIAMELKNGTHN